MTLHEKLSGVEADIVSAASLGSAEMHSVIFNKLAALDLSDPEDLEAVVLGLQEAHANSEYKFANFGAPRSTSDNILKTVALGSFLAPPIMHVVKYMMNKQSKEDGWNKIMASSPGVVAANPDRARMAYDLLHESSPNIARNTPLAADLIRQMTTMPQLDLGTVKGLSEISRNFRKPESDDIATKSLGALSDVPSAMTGYHALSSGSLPGKTANFGVPAVFKAADGSPTVFNWASEFAKEAGLTDAFSGPGTTMDQANNAFNMNQEEQGNTLLPLDSIVRELISKEQELMQREETIAQQEQQMQQAMAQLQQMAEQYQSGTGVDPSTGQPAQQGESMGEGSEDPASAAPAAEDPAAAAAPTEDPAAAAAAPPMADPGAAPAQDPGMAQDPNQMPADGAGVAPEGDPNAASPTDPNAAPTDASSGDDAAAAEGSAGDAASGNADDVPPDGTSGEATSPSDDTQQDDTSDEDQSDGTTSDDVAASDDDEAAAAASGDEGAAQAPVQLPTQVSPEEEQQARAMMAEQSQSMPSADQTAGGAPPEDDAAMPSDGAPPDEGAAPPAEEGGGEAPPAEGAEGEGAPPAEGEEGEGAPPAEGEEGETPPAEGEEGPPAEGEEGLPTDGGEAPPMEGDPSAPPMEGDPSAPPMGEGEAMMAAGDDTPKDMGSAMPPELGPGMFPQTVPAPGQEAPQEATISPAPSMPGEQIHTINIPVRVTVKLSEAYDKFKEERQW